MIILLSSQSFRLLREYRQGLENSFKKKAGPSGQITWKETTKDTTALEFSEWISSRSLFAKKQLIFVRDALINLTADQQKKLAEQLKSFKNEDTTLVFLELEPLPSMTRSNLYAYLKRSARVKKIKVLVLTGSKLVSDLQKRSRDMGIELEAAAGRLLVEKTKNDYDRALFELDKLAACLLAISKLSISVQDIKQLIEDSMEADIFKAIEALANRDKRQALSLLHRHMRAGAHPLYLLTMMRYQFRTLVLVADACHRTENFKEIASKTKLPPFAVRRAQGQLSKFDLPYLKAIFNKMVDADEAIKTGRVDGDVAVDLLALAICR